MSQIAQEYRTTSAWSEIQTMLACGYSVKTMVSYTLPENEDSGKMCNTVLVVYEL